MDIGKAFSYVFDDEDWIKKVVIGGLLGIIPIVNFIVVGYALRLIRNVAEGAERPLPEWDNWGDDFVCGLLVAVAAFLYWLPALIVMGIGSGIGALLGSSSDTGDTAALCVTAFQCLGSLWSILVAIVFPSAMLQYVMNGEFGDFFKFGTIIAFIRDNLGNYVIALLVSALANIVAGFGVILCFVGVIFTQFWSYVVMAHLFGQVWREANPPAPPLSSDTFVTGVGQPPVA